jgi:hypothetical protein
MKKKLHTVIQSCLLTVLTSYRLIVLLTVLQSYSLTVLSQDLQFYREDIVFQVNENAVITDAVYHFCNVGDKEIKTPLFYPFPENTIEQIDSLVIWNVKTQEVIQYRKGHSGVIFQISVNAYGQSAYRVYFQQWLKEEYFKYILSSTETWQRGLEFANYELQVPVSIQVDSMSYTPDSTYIKNETRYYLWKKKDFMPDKDFEIYFFSH